MCCFAVCSVSFDLFFLFGQVGICFPGGLEPTVRLVRTVLCSLGSDADLSCLKVDMTNAFNL